MEEEIWQAYQSSHPGQVQVLGPDLWNGSAPQLQTFQTQTGASFPLLLNGGTASGGNLTILYGPYDNYVVVDRAGIVQYHAALSWPHGNRFHLAEILSAVDSALATSDTPDPPDPPDPNDPPDPPDPPDPNDPPDPPDPNDPPGGPGSIGSGVPGSLAVAPNPFSARARVELAGPSSGSWSARVQVLDVLGRRVATLWDGQVTSRVLVTQWDGRGDTGQVVASGVYFIRAAGTDVSTTTRVLFVR